MNKILRQILGASLALGLLVPFETTADLLFMLRGQKPSVTLSGNERILLSDLASEQLISAAELLAEMIEQSSGAVLPIVATQDIAGITIDGGSTNLTPEPLPSGLDNDGFVIFVEESRILILGPTDWGTEFGVYDFLERFLGVRWLIPGADGTDVPLNDPIEIPQRNITNEPAFFSRFAGVLPDNEQHDWARFNREHKRIEYHHNLLKLFPAAIYTDSHPEFFPVKTAGQTERYLPADGAHDWQPCFTATGIVDEAVSNIVDYFNENPEKSTYSLGMNDSTVFCHCEECEALIPEGLNFLGRPHLSEVYYDWCNQVIEGVLAVLPDKWFGCLAYHDVAAAPTTLTLHPRLIPHLTYDRMKWADPEIRETNHDVSEDWSTAAANMGWYNYYYGSPYCLPRIYPHLMQTNLQYGYSQNVRTVTCELYPNWGEGPKAYIALKLWWNPDANVDALLTEWYERFGGAAAAPHLAAYYDIWEDFWTHDVPNSGWFTEPDQWLQFNTLEYLKDVRYSDVTNSRALLDTALSLCETDKQTARVNILRDSFEYYEASALAHLANQDLATTHPSTEADALQLITDSTNIIIMAEERRNLVDSWASDPVLKHPLTYKRYGALAGEEWGSAGLWNLIDWVDTNTAVTTELTALVETAASKSVRFQAAVTLAIARGELSLVGTNASFEAVGSSSTSSAGWGSWVKYSTGTLKRITTGPARTGTASVQLDGVFRAGPYQRCTFQGRGTYYAIAWIYAPEGQAPGGRVDLSVSTSIADKRTFGCTQYPEPGRWTPIVTRIDLSGAEYEGKTGTLLLVPVACGFEKNGGRVYLDDVGLYKLPDLSPLPQARWRLDDNTNTTAVAEAIGLPGNEGTALQNTSLLHANGVNGGAFQFNGTTDYINCGNSTSLSNFTSKTVLLWMKAGGYTGSPRYMYNDGSTASPYGDYIKLDSNTDRVMILLGNTAGSYQYHLFDLPVNEWIMAGYSWDGETVTYYSNNVAVATDSLSGTLACSGSNGLFLGAVSATSGRFDGLLDDVRIYDHALNAAQVNALYLSHPIP